jgi:hypothetical protein
MNPIQLIRNLLTGGGGNQNQSGNAGKPATTTPPVQNPPQNQGGGAGFLSSIYNGNGIQPNTTFQNPRGIDFSGISATPLNQPTIGYKTTKPFIGAPAVQTPYTIPALLPNLSESDANSTIGKYYGSPAKPTVANAGSGNSSPTSAGGTIDTSGGSVTGGSGGTTTTPTPPSNPYLDAINQYKTDQASYLNFLNDRSKAINAMATGTTIPESTFIGRSGAIEANTAIQEQNLLNKVQTDQAIIPSLAPVQVAPGSSLVSPVTGTDITGGAGAVRGAAYSNLPSYYNDYTTAQTTLQNISDNTALLNTVLGKVNGSDATPINQLLNQSSTLLSGADYAKFNALLPNIISQYASYLGSTKGLSPTDAFSTASKEINANMSAGTLKSVLATLQSEATNTLNANKQKYEDALSASQSGNTSAQAGQGSGGGSSGSSGNGAVPNPWH